MLYKNPRKDYLTELEASLSRVSEEGRQPALEKSRRALLSHDCLNSADQTLVLGRIDLNI
jgi:hypothetical protein